MSKLSFKKQKSDKGKKIEAAEKDPTDIFNLPPKFCLREMQEGYSVKDCDKNGKAAFAERLYELSRLTWLQLLEAGRHGQGYEKISRNSIKDKKGLAHISNDASIIAFRCIGKAPMVGYRSPDGVFNILWIDHNFSLYDHGK